LPAIVLAITTFTVGCNRDHAPPPPVDVVISKPITNEAIKDWDVYTGYVEAKEVKIESRVTGTIKEVLFQEGTEIPEGKLLFVIDDGPYQADLAQAKGQLTTWQAKLKAAEETMAIYKPLAEKGTIAKEELVKVAGAKGEALGGIGTAKGKIEDAEHNISYCKIASPIAGKVGEAMLTKGNLVTAGKNLLTTVISVDPMYVYFYVNERAFLTYQAFIKKRHEENKAAVLVIHVELALSTDADFPYKGVLDFMDNKVDKSTGMHKFRARFENAKRADGQRPLTAGLFARVRVAIGDAYKPILIAQRAILSDKSLKYVLVVNRETNVVERVDIQPAERLQPDGLVAVESGLKGDEWVIVEGVNRAWPGATVNPHEGPMPRRPMKK